MKKTFGRGLLLATCLLVALGLLAGPVMAAPAAYPGLFNGTASVDDEPVDAGTEITAWVGTEQVGSTLTGAGGLDANQFVLSVELEAGAEVSFKIGELDALETAAFVQYGAVAVTLTAYTAEVTLVSIAVTPESVSLNVGETQQLAITATYSDASTAVVTADATYVSDTESVATVSIGGLIIAVAEGTAIITVSYETETADVSVTVVSVWDPIEAYDADEDGVIDKTEAVDAVSDYFDNIITKDQAIAVLWLYFS